MQTKQNRVNESLAQNITDFPDHEFIHSVDGLLLFSVLARDGNTEVTPTLVFELLTNI